MKERMTQTLTYQNLGHPRYDAWYLGYRFPKFRRNVLPPFLTVKEKNTPSFSRFLESKAQLLFKMYALIPLKRKKQLTRIYCVTFKGKWNTYRNEHKILTFSDNVVTRYRIFSTLYLFLRFNFCFEQTQPLNQHTLKATYTPVCINLLHLISPTPFSPLLLIGEYRQFYCAK
jgi:hypothetical protein